MLNRRNMFKCSYPYLLYTKAQIAWRIRYCYAEILFKKLKKSIDMQNFFKNNKKTIEFFSNTWQSFIKKYSPIFLHCTSSTTYIPIFS